MRVLYGLLLSFASANRANPSQGLAPVLIQSASNLAKSFLADTNVPDHVHIVCHHHGCREVEAKLEVVKKEKIHLQQDLQECGKDRTMLENDLKAVAQERALVENKLKKCGEGRAVLEKQVNECGKHRSQNERALAKCAREREELEKDLTQCAEVDTPAAKKALNDCGIARQALEKELRELEEKLKNGGTSKTRRRQAGRRRSLLQTNATDNLLDDGEMDVEAGLSAQIALVQQKLKDEALKEWGIVARLEEFGNKIEMAERAIANSDADFDQYTDLLENKDAELKEIKDRIGVLGEEFNEASKAASALDRKMSSLNLATQTIIQKESRAQQHLFGHFIAEGKLQLKLLSMYQAEKADEEKTLREEHAGLSKSLAEKKALVSQKEKDKEDCDQLRATVITLTGTLQATQHKLNDCLHAKVGIKEKIKGAQRALGKANAGLQKCVTHKARLTAALKECGERCLQVEGLLAECLSRKKVLKTKITECHTARDLTRNKLKECLERKDELKEKIEGLEEKVKNMGLLQGASRAHNGMTLSSAVQAILGVMNSIDRAEAKAEAEAASFGSEESTVATMESGMTQVVSEASEAFGATEKAIKQAFDSSTEVEADLVEVEQELKQSSIENEAAQARAHFSRAEAKKALSELVAE